MRISYERLLEVAERQAALAVVKEDAYAELLIGPASDGNFAGTAGPPITLRFPLEFAGIAR